MYPASFVLIASVMAVATLFWPRLEHSLDHCMRRIAQIPAGRFEELLDYIVDRPEADRRFWVLSQGVRGVVKRVRYMSTALNLLQYCVLLGVVKSSDAAEVWHLFRMQIFFSVIALPEACICILWKELPHVAALESLRFHFQATLRIRTLCLVDGAPECILKRGLLL
jgi:hypothetical protein